MPADTGPVVDEFETEEHDTHERRRAGWLPWLTLALVLLAVAWLIYRYSDLGRAPDVQDVGRATVRISRVPDVVGLSRAEAVSTLEAGGFTVGVETSFDALAAPDTVVSQDPAAGSRAAAASTVYISVAGEARLTPGEAARVGEEPRLSVPDVVGTSLSDARELLDADGFSLTVSEVYSANVPKGEVIDQTPVGGTVGEPGDTVGLVVSAGAGEAAPIEVPPVVGLSRDAAVEAVRAAGLEPRIMYQPNDSAVGLVYRQSPAEGTMVPADRYVFLLVGARP